MNLKTGFFVVGELRGLKERPWSGDNQGVDHLLGITISRPDSWGSKSDITFAVKVYSNEVSRVESFCNQHMDKLVQIQFAMITRKSKSGKQWQEYAITSDCILTVLSEG